MHGASLVTVTILPFLALLVLLVVLVRRAARRRERLLLLDPMTGIPNRRALEFGLRDAAIAAAADPSHQLILSVVALKELKMVGDEFGQEFADRVLVEVYERLRASVPTASVTRLDGDELAGFASSAAPLGIAVAELSARLKQLSQPVEVDGRTVVVHACAGLAVAGPDDDARDTLRNAGLALRKARRLDHAAVCTYEPSMLDELTNRMTLEREFERALALGEFEVHYQPIVAIHDGRPAGVEALVRWRHRDRGLLSPATFVPLAEANGFIVPLGAYVLSEACKQMQRWRADPALAELGVHVNVSPRQLVSLDFVTHVRGVLAESGLPPERLALEVTESDVTSSAAVARLRQLRALGVRIAVDDFGTGYSSLSTLVAPPFDILKIDRSFVDEIDRSPDRVLLTATIIRLGHQLGLVTVAEGVERAAQLDLLRTLRCDRVQGYLVGRPAPPDVALENLARLERSGSRMPKIASPPRGDAGGVVVLELGPTPSSHALAWVDHVKRLTTMVRDVVPEAALEVVTKYVERWERAALTHETFSWKGREHPSVLWALLRAGQTINDAYAAAPRSSALIPSPEVIAFHEQLVAKTLCALTGELDEPGSVDRIASAENAWPRIGPINAA